MNENKLEKIVSWAKRRGFVMPSSEIYGGIGGIYDFGHYGTALKNNIKKLWWKTFVESRDDIVGIDSSIIMSRKVWQASGHEKGFVDEMVECKKCHNRFRTDEIEKSHSERSEESPANAGSDIHQRSFAAAQDDILKCPNGGNHEFTEPKNFNPMFKTFVGATEDSSNQTYLRPETAQGMFTNFKQVLETSRKKLPFGIAQMGKSFRNEIQTKDFIFRVREFEIAEIEYFVKPGEDEKSFNEWLKSWEKFVLSLGIDKKNIRHFEHPKEKLSHYSKRTIDIQYNYPFGWKELTGLANRTDFDLKSHEEASGKDLKYYDQESGEKFWPYVIEPTLGIERLMLAVICDAFEESEPRTETTEAKAEKEITLHFHPSIAPVKVAVFPLVKKLSKEAREVYTELAKCWGDIEFDESGSIGRRYRRQDEIGTPFCITFDFDSIDDKKITVRDRDSMKQERVATSELKNYLFGRLNTFQ